jgi:hypothetical protein
MVNVPDNEKLHLGNHWGFLAFFKSGSAAKIE